jgi:hypothetical protein
VLPPAGSSPTAAARLRTPEATPTELRAYASTHPAAVLLSPALPLLALEDPAQYLAIVYLARYARAGVLLTAARRRLDAPRQRLLATDIAEHALPLFVALFPGDARPRAAIQAARQYAAGAAPPEALRAAHDAAHAAAFQPADPHAEARRVEAAHRAAEAAAAAATASAGEALERAISAATLAHVLVLAPGAAPPGTGDAAMVAVREWQLARARHYLAAERGKR